MKTLIIGPSWVGDMMMSQSLYRTLKHLDANQQIDVMAPAWCRPLLARMPEVSQALDMPLGHGKFHVALRYRLGKSLREQHYQRAFILPNSFKSALVPYFAKIPERIGWRGEMRYGLLNNCRTLDKNAFPMMVQRYVALAYDKQLVHRATDLPTPLLWPKLAVSNREITELKTQCQLPQHHTIIGFCPGAEFGPAKRWPHYHYANLAKLLIKEGAFIILLGSQKDREVTQRISEHLTPAERASCLDVAGTTSLDQAVVLIAGCDGVVTNDSGLMHIAAAVDCPLVALYGPTSPEFTPPLTQHATIIRLISGYHKVRKGDQAQGYHQSLIDIQPEHAFEALNHLLAAKANCGQKDN